MKNWDILGKWAKSKARNGTVAWFGDCPDVDFGFFSLVTGCLNPISYASQI